jgi:hypothetical protein
VGGVESMEAFSVLVARCLSSYVGNVFGLRSI